jgi:hypothetical protein
MLKWWNDCTKPLPGIIHERQSDNKDRADELTFDFAYYIVTVGDLHVPAS